jgi:alpha-D-ribose 1-methylphosphonate 5-triphosphate synthase subunit PhnH
VDFLPENTGDEAAADVAVQNVQRAFRAYVEALNARGATQVSIPELPADPLALSYLVAASIIADLHDRQALLAEPDALRRLAAERTLLSRETSMLRSLTSTPAPEFRYAPYSPN